MKKNLLLMALAALFVCSCSLDINNSPNYPQNDDISAEMIFPSVANSLAATIGDQMFNYGGFFAQYFEQKPEANQYNDLAEYRLDEGKNLFDRCYRTLYAGTLMDIQEVLARTSAPADVYACKVLRAYALTLVADNLNNAPYTEALQGAANTTPKWESGIAVYEGVLKEIDDAEAALTGSGLTLKDYVLGGDEGKWVQFANALRLRWYLRLDAAGQAGYSQKLKDLVAEGNFPDADITFDAYLDQEKQYNPWYAGVFELGTQNHVAAYPLVSYLVATSDPRIAYAIDKNEAAGAYVGQIPGAKSRMKEWSGSDWKNAHVSAINYGPAHAMPVYFFTAAEVQFLMAEVELNINNDLAAAKTAYNAGIALDFASRGVDDAGLTTFMANPAISLDGLTDKEEMMKRIGMQKWVALFYRDHMEAWSEARRTHIPACSGRTAEQVYKDSPAQYVPGDFIVPAVNEIIAGGLIKRVPYPENARKFNINTPAFETLDKKVFFDKN